MTQTNTSSDSETCSDCEILGIDRQPKDELITVINKIHEVDDIETRLLAFSQLAIEEMDNEGVGSQEEIKEWCNDFGTHEIVGTGLCCMKIDTVLQQLAEYTAYFEVLQLPDHGGDRDAVSSISGNNLNFQHNAFHALQTFYSKAIYTLVIKKLGIYNEEPLQSSSMYRAVYDRFGEHSLNRTDLAECRR